MKILFAVNNESISESIIKKYQQEYKEIISGRNVYYFNAIAKELQKDNTYDRIVISEDLEPFTNNNYEIIDKFIFEKLDVISDEASSNSGKDVPIILICTDRREKADPLLVKLFGIGVYSALIGQDRTITNVCELIHSPRNKKEAKAYYRIDSDDVDYKVEGEGDVSEIEIQNILNHYKKLGKNEELYVESFENIANQYTDSQLRVICNFLPLSVRAVLEAGSPKYQELITFGAATPSPVKAKPKKEKYVPNKEYHQNANNNQKLDILERNIGKSNLTQPVIIPSSVDIGNVKRTRSVNNIEQVPVSQPVINTARVENNTSAIDNEFEDIIPSAPIQNNVEPQMAAQQVVAEPPKRKRGRPRKVRPEEEVAAQTTTATIAQQPIVTNVVQPEMAAQQVATEPPKRKRGRPRKVRPEEEVAAQTTTATIAQQPAVTNIVEPEEIQNDTILPGFEDIEEEPVIETSGQNTGIILPGFEEEPSIEISEEPQYEPVVSNYEEEREEPQTYTGYNNVPEQPIERQQMQYGAYGSETKEVQSTGAVEDIHLDNVISSNKKVVAFVGTSKNGTSFLVNNLAESLSKKGIKTAILDLTKNRNAYYIYTQNDEQLRRKAFACITNLRNGVVEGIPVHKNLDVFTTLPDEDVGIEDYQSILPTLAQNYSIVIMDCDYSTNYGYFKNAQEIYLVQSYDILTIQPLTAFLRDLKSRDILDPEKLRVVLNKVLRVRSVTERMIVGGMSFYNDPAMSFMTELFNKDTIKYCSIPFEEQTYSRYLEGLVNCQITTSGYSKNFMLSLEKLSSMVYPLLANYGGSKKAGAYGSGSAGGFTSGMNSTLDKMKNNY